MAVPIYKFCTEHGCALNCNIACIGFLLLHIHASNGIYQGPYSMLTIRYVVTLIRYDMSVSISPIRNALKRVTICKVDLFYAPFAM